MSFMDAPLKHCIWRAENRHVRHFYLRLHFRHYETEKMKLVVRSQKLKELQSFLYLDKLE